MAQSELLWALLRDGKLEDIKYLNLEGFDWNSLHPVYNETLVVMAVESGMVRNHQEALNKIEWFISQGASITQKCTGGNHSIYEESNEDATTITVDCKDLSAITFVEEWREKLKANSFWENTYNFLGQVFTIFARTPSSSQNHRPKVSIDEGIAELWERCLTAKSTHDLTIETADGQVTAHAHMLKEASPVVRAMLASPMKEGQAQRIEVKDSSSAAVSLFLEILGEVT